MEEIYFNRPPLMLPPSRAIKQARLFIVSLINRHVLHRTKDVSYHPIYGDGFSDGDGFPYNSDGHYNREVLHRSTPDIIVMLVRGGRVVSCTIQHVLNNPTSYDWDWDQISRRPGLSIHDVIAHSSYPWDWFILSFHRDLTSQCVIKLMDKPWAWGYLSYHMSLTVILQHPDKQWDWSVVSSRSCLTFSVVLDHLPLPWDWACLSSHRNITLATILDHPTLPWNWASVSRNPNVTLAIVTAHPDIPWNWKLFSGNVSLSITDIINHPSHPWDYESVLRHTFPRDIIAYLWRQVSYRLIATHWITNTRHPHFKICWTFHARKMDRMDRMDRIH